MKTVTVKLDLTETQKAVYDAVLADERASLQEIADATGLSRMYVVAALDVLVALGLITRDPRKARSVRVVNEVRL